MTILGQSLRSRFPAPRGVSLLEVLISIFVLSVALLGVAAVIPVGRFEMVEAGKADRSAACAEAVLDDIVVRGMNNRRDWLAYSGWGDIYRGPLDGVGGPWVGPGGQLFPLLGESYAVDSLFLARNPEKTPVDPDTFRDFPYNPSNPGVPVLPGGWTRMQRVVWRGAAVRDPNEDAPNYRPALQWKPNEPLASAVHMWHDDLLFPAPTDATQRPGQLFLYDNSNNPLKGEFQGNYSWLVTATPAIEDAGAVVHDQNNTMDYVTSKASPVYTVSVVVFYKRDFSPPIAFGSSQSEETPAERQVRVELVGGGLGGGDVVLHVLPNPNSPTGWDPPQYLDIRQHEWLMISGARSAFDRDRDGNPDWWIGVHKWYRIVAAGDTVIEDANGNGSLDPGEDTNGNGALDPPYREATLAGPDWNMAHCYEFDGNPATSDAVAALFKGVVGVFSRTVPLNENWQ